MRKLIKFYRLLSLLSIDVAVGAACSSAWFAVLFGIEPRCIVLITLGLTVWIIYSIDHLIDARSIQQVATAKRHQFHQQYFYKIVLVVVVTSACDAALVFFIGTDVFIGGLWLSTLVGLYLISNRWLGFFKEFLIAVLYCMGILLPVLSLIGFPTAASEWFIISSFFLTVLINILLFSWFDFDADTRDGHQSFATVFGFTKTQRFISMLFVAQGLFQIAIAYLAGYQVFLLLSMNSILLLIFCKANSFRGNENFRLLGDAIFFFPLADLFLRRIF
jgi:hypothetical protein